MREAQTGVGCHALLQGMFPIQELNLGLLHCRRIVYHLSHEESPRILEWVVYPFSRRSSQPRNRTRVSCVAGGFFTSWTTREAHHCIDPLIIHWDLQSSNLLYLWFLLHLLAEILEETLLYITWYSEVQSLQEQCLLGVTSLAFTECYQWVFFRLLHYKFMDLNISDVFYFIEIINLILKLTHLWSVRNHSIYLVSLLIWLQHSIFLAWQAIPCSCLFSVPDMESTISPRNGFSFYEKFKWLLWWSRIFSRLTILSSLKIKSLYYMLCGFKSILPS